MFKKYLAAKLAGMAVILLLVGLTFMFAPSGVDMNLYEYDIRNYATWVFVITLVSSCIVSYIVLKRKCHFSIGEVYSLTFPVIISLPTLLSVTAELYKTRVMYLAGKLFDAGTLTFIQYLWVFVLIITVLAWFRLVHKFHDWDCSI